MKKKAKKMIVCMGGALIVLGMVIVCIYHYSLIQKESAILQPNGTLNNVEGQNLHVYQEGAGEDTYVFMAGSGIAAPVYELKGLYRQFSQHHQIAVVDRAGYGYSDVAHDDRGIDTILAQTREALLQSGLEPPYVLVPHSISG